MSSTSTTSDKSSERIAVSGFTLAYKIVFDIGKPINPIVAARRLLKEDFVDAFCNPITNDIELAKRYAWLLKIRQQGEQGKEFSALFEDLNLRSLLAWVIKNPRFTFFLLKAFAGRKKSIESDSGNDSKTSTGFADIVNEVDNTLVSAQVLSSLHLDEDKKSFNPFYREQSPFTRLTLQPLIANVNGARKAVDIELLIHRSGSAILTFYLTFDEATTIDELVDLQSLKNLIAKDFEIPFSLARYWSKAEGLSRRKLAESASAWYYSNHIDWLVFSDRYDNFISLFEIYRLAVTAVVLGKRVTNVNHPYSWLRTDSWFAYPVLLIKETTPSCLYSSDFKARFAKELAALNLKIKMPREVEEAFLDTITREDLSFFKGESFFYLLAILWLFIMDQSCWIL